MGLPYIIEQEDGSNNTYEIYSRLLKDRIIFIDGEFNTAMANGVVAQLLFLHTDDPKKDIYMYINSPGGDIPAMYAIYDVMNYVSADINTVGIGMVASAGSFILASGAKGKRSCLKNAEIMIHELSAGTSGKVNDIFKDVEHYKKLYDKMAKQYASFTGQTMTKLKRDMQRDFFMSAEEALKYGLIDKIVEKA